MGGAALRGRRFPARIRSAPEAADQSKRLAARRKPCPFNTDLPSRQRDSLTVVAKKVLNLDRVGIDLHDLVTALDNFALAGDEDVVARLDIDAEVSLRQLTRDTATQLERLGPFGQGNPRPVFATHGVRLAAPPRRVGSKSDHLQFAITDNTATIRCVGFRMGHLEKKLLDNEYFNIAYEAQLNHYNGNTSVEFITTDIQFE